MATATDLLATLTDIVGSRHVLTSHDASAPYQRERRGLFNSNPLAVVRPGDTQAVADTVAACAQHSAAIIPQGGNTGLVGGSIADRRHTIVLSLERLSHVRTVDPANRTLTAEAGCPLASVQSAAKEADRFFPLSYAAESECQLGGNLATNAGGMNVLRYGNARELTLGLEVVLADGRIWNGLTGLRKDNAGYDLRDLFIGSEGTLGIITAAVMRLFPRPRQTVTALVALDQPEDAVSLLDALQAATGEAISAFELMSRFSIATAVHYDDGCCLPFNQSAPWYVVLDAATTRETDALADWVSSTLRQRHSEGRLREWHLSSTADERARLWRPRNQIPAAQRQQGASIKHDIAVPVSRVPEFLRRADQLMAGYMAGIRPCAFGHVGDGNIHYNLSQPEHMAAEDFLAHWQPVTERIHDLVCAMGGSFAAEHGIGRLKTAELERLKSPVETQLMGAIKGALDPANRLNPGAVTAPRQTPPLPTPSDRPL
jgi:D-lactate dehydrogenase (cytochrome)